MKIKRSIRITALLVLLLLNAAVLNNCESWLVLLSAIAAQIGLFWRLIKTCRPYLLPTEPKANPTPTTSSKK